MVKFRLNSAIDQGWAFNLYPSGHWQLDYPDPQGNPSKILGTLPGGDLNDPVTIMIISKDTGCAIYLDGTPIAYSSDMSEEYGDEIRLGLIGARTDEGEAGRPTNLTAISIKYDDLKLWNLDNI